MKVARTVWSGGKMGDNFKDLPITIMGGACLCATSCISLLDGTYQTIEQLVKEERIQQIPCIDINTGKQTVGNISQYCDVGIKPTLKINGNV